MLLQFCPHALFVSGAMDCKTEKMLLVTVAADRRGDREIRKLKLYEQ